MKYVVVDVESYWDTEYSLSKLSPLEYVLDPRWEMQALSVKVGNAPSKVALGMDEINSLVSQVDWRDAYVLGHNLSGFDAYVLAYRLGIRPKFWGCTLAMARPIYAKVTKLNLGDLARFLNVGIKDNSILIQTKGKRLEDFTYEERMRMRAYNGEDDDLCWGIFKKLLPFFTADELWQIDLLTRMRTEPAFHLDMPMLEAGAAAERARQRAMLLDVSEMLGYDQTTDEDTTVELVRGDMASSARFAEVLSDLGVQVPLKPSPKVPGMMIPALAKTDAGMLDLMEHEDELVAAAAAARLDVKSTITGTRIEKYIAAGSLTGGKWPVPLLYCGADTTGRDSGTEYNPLNMPRVDKRAPKISDALRRSLVAPPGYKIIVADESQIELRVNHFLWQVPSTMALYRHDPTADPYTASGVRLHGRDITPQERQVEKVKNLGLGFGSGAQTFVRVARSLGGLILTLEESQQYVDEWRGLFPEIAGKRGGWNACNEALQCIARGQEDMVDPWGLVHTCAQGFILPSGRLIRYPGIHQEPDGHWDDGRPKTSWFYGQGRFRARIHGPKADENIVQALARDILFDITLNMFEDTGWRPALRVYDELAYVVPEGEAEGLLNHLHGLMRTPPAWWPQLVTWSSGSIADRYGDAK
jgi:DNA polymerase